MNDDGWGCLVAIIVSILLWSVLIFHVIMPFLRWLGGL